MEEKFLLSAWYNNVRISKVKNYKKVDLIVYVVFIKVLVNLYFCAHLILCLWYLPSYTYLVLSFCLLHMKML